MENAKPEAQENFFPEQEKQQPAASVKAAKTLPLWLVSLIVGAGIALYVQDFFHVSGGGKKSNESQYVVLDAKLLIDAKAAQVASLAVSDSAAAARETTAFSENLKLAVQKYSAAGYVVLNAGYVIQWPESVDITPRIAEELGINLSMAKKAPLPSPVAEQAPQAPVPQAAVSAPEATAQPATPAIRP